MSTVVHLSKSLNRDMRVPLGRGKTCMPQEFLNPTQVRTAIQQMGRKRVPQGVGVQTDQPSPHSCSLNNSTNGTRRHGRPPTIGKDYIGQSRQVFKQVTQCHNPWWTNRHTTLLPTFSTPHGQHTSLKIDISPPKSGNFPYA
jgi:hypothetical protein